jgi:hypothetical protein
MGRSLLNHVWKLKRRRLAWSVNVNSGTLSVFANLISSFANFACAELIIGSVLLEFSSTIGLLTPVVALGRGWIVPVCEKAAGCCLFSSFF